MINIYLKAAIMITDLEKVVIGVEREKTLKTLLGAIIRKKRI